MKTLTFICMPVLLALCSVPLHAQFITVTGTVKDVLSGETISQLNVVEKNSGIGTISSMDGSYFLALRKGEVELIFSDEDHAPYTVDFFLRKDTTINVSLRAVHDFSGKKARRDADLLTGKNKLVAVKETGKK